MQCARSYNPMALLAMTMYRAGSGRRRWWTFVTFIIIITLLHETIFVRLIVRGEFNPKLIHRLKYILGIRSYTYYTNIVN